MPPPPGAARAFATAPPVALVVEVPPEARSPWARPPHDLREPPPPAAPAPEAPATLASDGSLNVEIVHGDDADGEDNGSDLIPEVRVGGRRIRGLVRVGLAAAVVAAAAVGGLVATRDSSTTFLVQTSGGTIDVKVDHATAPSALWSYRIPEDTTVTSVSQGDDAVYIAMRNDTGTGEPGTMTVVALDAAGTPQWTYDVTADGGSIHATPAGVLVNVQDGRGAYATMLALADGTVRWQLDGFVTQAPGEAGIGIVQQLNGRVALGLEVIDLDRGTPRWTPAGSLRTGLGLGVIVDANCDEVQGRSATTGLVQWRFAALDGTTFCNRGRPQLTVASDRVVVADGSDLVGLDASGQERWRRPLAGQALAGSNGTWVWLRQQSAPAEQTYLDAATGAELDSAAAALIVNANRDRTVLAHTSGRPLVLLDEGDAMMRVDPRTGQPKGAAMPGAGAAGIGLGTVYRLSADGDALVGFDLATGRQRWSVPVSTGGDGATTVWAAGRVIVVGAGTGTLTAYG